MKSKALITFSRLTGGEFADKCRYIISCLTDNPVFPSPIPSVTDLSNATEDYIAILSAAASGNRSDIAAKNAQRQMLTAMLQQLADYINHAAAGDKAMLLTSGFDLNKEPQPIIITKPGNLRLTNGSNPGELIVSVKAVKGAKAYVYEYTMDPSMAAGSWITTTASKRKIVFTGLQPGKRYYCRVAAIGANGQMIYSDVASRIVI